MDMFYLQYAGIEYEMTDARRVTLLAHGLIREQDGYYRFSTEEELRLDPGSVGVNNNQAGALLAVVDCLMNLGTDK